MGVVPLEATVTM